MSSLTDTEMQLARKRYGQHTAQSRHGQKTDRNGTVVEFRLTFDEWLGLWLASGHYHERGACKGGYVLSRINDLGHYEVGNVFIQSHADNIREASVRNRCRVKKTPDPVMSACTVGTRTEEGEGIRAMKFRAAYNARPADAYVCGCGFATRNPGALRLHSNGRRCALKTLPKASKAGEQS
jgi:hypothetical protein